MYDCLTSRNAIRLRHSIFHTVFFVDKSKRNTLLLLSGLGAGYFAIRNIPDLIPQRLNFTEVAEPAGFRKFVAGEYSSAAGNPFVGLDGAEDEAVRVAKKNADARVRADVCAALYGGVDFGPDQVPIASFSDYYCPFCRVQTKKLAELAKAREGDIAVAWHELPLLGENSDIAARAALAAKRQGAYVEFHDQLMRSAFVATPEYLASLSENIGVDEERLVSDMASADVEVELQDSAALSRLFAFVGTPALVIGRTIIQGQVSDATINKIIALEREEGWAAQCGTA